MKQKNIFYCFILLLFTVFLLVIGTSNTIYAEVHEFYSGDGFNTNFYKLSIDPTIGPSSYTETLVWDDQCWVTGMAWVGQTLYGVKAYTGIQEIDLSNIPIDLFGESDDNPPNGYKYFSMAYDGTTLYVAADYGSSAWHLLEVDLIAETYTPKCIYSFSRLKSLSTISFLFFL